MLICIVFCFWKNCFQDDLSEATDQLTDNHHKRHTGLQSSALCDATLSFVVVHQNVHLTDVMILIHCFMFLFQFPERRTSMSLLALSVTMLSRLPGDQHVKLTVRLMSAPVDQSSTTNWNTEKQTVTLHWGRQEGHAGRKSMTSKSHMSRSQVGGYISHGCLVNDRTLTQLLTFLLHLKCFRCEVRLRLHCSSSSSPKQNGCQWVLWARHLGNQRWKHEWMMSEW